jgi:thioredoxin reductase (NADPH)
VLDGKVAIRDGDGPAARLVAVHGAGRFLGELSLLTGQAAFFTAEVIEPGEVLACRSSGCASARCSTRCSGT